MIFLFLHQMFTNEVVRKLENLIRGTVIQEQSDTCTTIRNKLCSSFSTSTTVKKDFESKSIIKKEQERFLQQLAISDDYWVTHLPKQECYLGQGGEATVYLHEDLKSVIKTNDGVYYATWLEYFNSLVIHNLLFPETAYTVLGFTLIENAFHVVLKQPFIASDSTADLDTIKQLLTHNGFINTRRQDYFNKEYGLILEDMHDENVILKDDSLFFIDTVFYLIHT